MPSNLKALSWITAKTLHQVQILSCDLCRFVLWDSPDHCAPFWRLYRHDQAGGEIKVGDSIISILPKHLVLIPPNTHFSSRLRNPIQQLFLHFLVEPRFCGRAENVFQFRASKQQSSLCAGLIAELSANTASIRASFLAQMLVSSALMDIPSEAWLRRFEDPRITRAVETISNAYPAKVKNIKLAREARMHPSAFIRLFRHCTGHTPRRYLTNLRLEEACAMLHYDDASLEEIAEKTGFGERGYFTRVFSRDMNCSPGRYRKLVNVHNRLRPGD